MRDEVCGRLRRRLLLAGLASHAGAQFLAWLGQWVHSPSQQERLDLLSGVRKKGRLHPLGFKTIQHQLDV